MENIWKEKQRRKKGKKKKKGNVKRTHKPEQELILMKRLKKTPRG
jgi:hypothetical protein